jgi:hypothetical protein
MSVLLRASWSVVALAAVCSLVYACGSDDDGSTTDGGVRTDGAAETRDGGSVQVTPGPDGGSVGQGDAGAQGALPPGSPCVVNADAGKMVSTYCQDNPALPTCFACVDFTENGLVDGVCVFTCRMGQPDCPQGQTCTASGSMQRTSYQPCRDKTNGQELGYCR